MKAIDMFANVVGQVMEDGHVQKYGAILLTRGVSGLGKLNPTVVWVDATVAVIEAAGSYFRYCAAREVTEQLREYNRMLEATLAQDLQLGELEIKAIGKERKGRLAHIERTLGTTRRQILLSQKKVRKQLSLLKHMHTLLQEERLQSGSFQELIGLQVCLDSCIDATLALLLNSNGE
ncbi:hypothetical protein HW090_11220 [Pseudomonas sp. ABC1]|uniref:hypothetical protein n=1 Tax=Pseudomonas sp. ABC1 TaxID=2748080 RepID=UPI0015C3DE20|nr:hypothetical protein [Pseudomonas sp. ABC1]QLF93732.1 hypothetical protein HW090_11220 [Pseudomonas sp. ABC1]